MSYRFEHGETIPDGVRRIAREQIDEALELLTAPADDDWPLEDDVDILSVGAALAVLTEQPHAAPEAFGGHAAVGCSACALMARASSHRMLAIGR